MNEIRGEQLSTDLKKAIDSKDIDNLRYIANFYYPGEIAEALNNLDVLDTIKLLRWLEPEPAAKIFAEIGPDEQKSTIEQITSQKLTQLLDELYADEVADLIQEMPSNIVKKILKSTPREQRTVVNKILDYAEDTAGAMMSVDFIELDSKLSNEKAIETIRKAISEVSETEYFFIVNKQNILQGTVQLKDLVFSDKPLKELINRRFIAVKTNDDQEAVANIMQKYELPVVPVVNNENRLVGVLDESDMVEILQAEAGEDIQKLAGINPIERQYFEISIWKMVKSRMFWLSFLMVSDTLVQLIINLFITIYKVPGSSSAGGPEQGFPGLNSYIFTVLLVPLLPLLSGTSGNAGSQSSSIVVRALALRDVDVKDYWRVLWKELRIGVFVGLILVGVNFVRQIIIYFATSPHTINKYQWLAIVTVSCALLFTTVFAKIIGGTLPIIAKAFKIDPAVMSVPLLTTVLDGLTTAIYFGIGIFTFLIPFQQTLHF